MDREHFLSAGFDNAMYLWHVDGQCITNWQYGSRLQDMCVNFDRTL